MNPTHRPLRINIGFLINQPVGFLREIPIDLKNYSFENEFPVENLNGVITLARTQNGIRALVELRAKIEAECDRCLEPYQQELNTSFEEIFTFENRPLSEDETIIPEDGNLDFETLIREYLILDMPVKQICRPECKGLCSVCGQNLNENDCGHSSAAPVSQRTLADFISKDQLEI